MRCNFEQLQSKKDDGQRVDRDGYQGMNCYFAIIGNSDNPLYEADFLKERDERHLHQFILHSALDLAEDSSWNTTAWSITLIKLFESSRPVQSVECLMSFNSGRCKVYAAT